MRRVLIIQPYVPAYRRALFEQMRARGRDRGIDLNLVAGRPARAQRARADEVRLSWARHVRSWESPVPRLPLRLKAVPLAEIRAADLVVGELSVGAAETWALAATRKMCLWGHGYGAVSGGGRADEALETFLLKRSRRFFSYTQEGRRHAVRRGLPDDRITVLDNTIDTSAIVTALARVTPDAVADYCRQHALGQGPVVGFIGGFDESKRLNLLFEAAASLHHRIPSLRLLLAGDGEQRAAVDRFCGANPWARRLGRIDEQGKALMARVCSLLLNPGRVGLIAVDSFAMHLPLATTRWPHHAPEFSYLDETNSLVTADELASFIAGVADLLVDSERLSTMKKACAASAEHFSIEAMADRFLGGLEESLH